MTEAACPLMAFVERLVAGARGETSPSKSTMLFAYGKFVSPVLNLSHVRRNIHSAHSGGFLVVRHAYPRGRGAWNHAAFYQPGDAKA